MLYGQLPAQSFMPPRPLNPHKVQPGRWLCYSRCMHEKSEAQERCSGWRRVTQLGSGDARVWATTELRPGFPVGGGKQVSARQLFLLSVGVRLWRKKSESLRCPASHTWPRRLVAWEICSRSENRKLGRRESKEERRKKGRDRRWEGGRKRKTTSKFSRRRLSPGGTDQILVIKNPIWW